MYDKTFLVRLSAEQHAKFKRALALYGGSMSGITRKLVDDWSNDIILNEVIMYGFKKGNEYVKFFNIGKGKVNEVIFGTKGEAFPLRLRDGLTMEDLQDIAGLLGCELVRLD